MASSYKTDFLKLNHWLPEDKPKRLDFVTDNEIIDSTLKEHVQNEAVHVSAEEKEAWNNNTFDIASHIFMGTYSGSGQVERVITLEKSADFILIFKAGAIPVKYENMLNQNKAFIGFATNQYSTLGLKLEDDKLTIGSKFSEAVANEGYFLNDRSSVYVYVGFKLG